MRLPIVRALVVVAGCLTSTSPTFGQDTVWTLRPAGTIQGWAHTISGMLLVATDRELMGVDADSGTVRWIRPDLGDRPRLPRTGGAILAWPQEVRIVARRADIAIVHVDSAQSRAHVEAVDIQTGVKQWDSREHLQGDVRGVSTVWFDSLLILTLAEDGRHPLVISAVDERTGEPQWSVRGGLGEVTLFEHYRYRPRPRAVADLGPAPVHDSDTTLMLYLSPVGPVRIDRRSGAVLWRMQRPLASPARGRLGFDAPFSEQGVLFAAAERELVALDAETGRPRWPAPIQLQGFPASVDSVSGGWLVRAAGGFERDGTFSGKSELFVLDSASGQSRWPEPARHRSVSSNVVLLGDSAVIGDGDKVSMVALANGNRRGVHYFGSPYLYLQNIDTIGSDFLVASSTMLARVTRDGVVVYQVEWSPLAPGYFTNRYFVEGALIVAGQFPMPAEPVSTPIPGQASPTTVYLPRLARIDLETGTITHLIPFEASKPWYTVWSSRRLLIVQTNDHTLKAYRF